MAREAVILMVEDNRLDVELTLDAFAEVRLSNDVRVVGSGERAMEYLEGVGDFTDRMAHPMPDLILLDIHLPGMSGMDLLRRMRLDNRFRRLPAVILTSSDTREDRNASFDLGICSYLVKPVTFDGFVKVIQSVESYWISLYTGSESGGAHTE